MVEGKLTEKGEEPKNVQVVLIDLEEGVVIELRNGDGAIMTIEPEPERKRDHEERLTDESDETAGITDEGEAGSGADAHAVQLERELARLTEENTALQEEVSGLKDGIEGAKRKYKELWRMNCEQLGEYVAKEDEVERLKERIVELEAHGVAPASETERRPSMSVPPGLSTPRSTIMRVRVPPDEKKTASHVTHSLREPRGKTPPIDPFDGERAEVTFEDWLPTPQRAATWNGWSEEESFMQLAGYL